MEGDPAARRVEQRVKVQLLHQFLKRGVQRTAHRPISIPPFIKKRGREGKETEKPKLPSRLGEDGLTVPAVLRAEATEVGKRVKLYPGRSGLKQAEQRID